MNTSNLETTTAFDNKTQAYITCIYCYPNSSIPNFINDITTISAATTNHQKILIGDFNINAQSQHSNTIEKICKALGTKQLINQQQQSKTQQ